MFHEYPIRAQNVIVMVTADDAQRLVQASRGQYVTETPHTGQTPTRALNWKDPLNGLDHHNNPILNTAGVSNLHCTMFSSSSSRRFSF